MDVFIIINSPTQWRLVLKLGCECLNTSAHLIDEGHSQMLLRCKQVPHHITEACWNVAIDIIAPQPFIQYNSPCLFHHKTGRSKPSESIWSSHPLTIHFIWFSRDYCNANTLLCQGDANIQPEQGDPNTQPDRGDAKT